MQLPDNKGYFGDFGGMFVPELLIPALKNLEDIYNNLKDDPKFQSDIKNLLTHYAGRPTPLYRARNLEQDIGPIKIYLKREDLNHTGAHKLNNTLGQGLLTLKANKKKVIAETGAGQHGVATATAAACLGLECTVFMGEKDMERQALNVRRMKLLGAKVEPVYSGSKTLKDACNEALRFWASNVGNTHYIIGSVVGPHPYPMLVRDFQSVIGKEARMQILEQEGRLPDILIACVGGGSNAIGIFNPFFNDKGVKFIGVEAAGLGIETGKHAATLEYGRPGVLHGSHSYVLQDAWGQIIEAHSIAAGLDYPGVGPEHSYYKNSSRAEYHCVTDDEAVSAFHWLSKREGIIPALESSHALAYLRKTGSELKPGTVLILNLSGRGDKDTEPLNTGE